MLAVSSNASVPASDFTEPPSLNDLWRTRELDFSEALALRYAHGGRSQPARVTASVGGHDTEIAIDLQDPRRIIELRSPTHDLRIDGKGERLRVTAVARGEPKELVLRWKLASAAMTLQAWVHRPKGEDPYVVLSIAAPPNDPAKRVAKDVTLVLDESGSMGGDALENGKRVAAEIVRRLASTGRLNVILFDAPKTVTKDIRSEALAFLDGAGHGGGTDIAGALDAALERQGNDSRPKSILLMTDGNSDRDAAAAIVAKDEHDVRLFTVGIGQDTDRAGLTPPLSG